MKNETLHLVSRLLCVDVCDESILRTPTSNHHGGGVGWAIPSELRSVMCSSELTEDSSTVVGVQSFRTSTVTESQSKASAIGHSTVEPASTSVSGCQLLMLRVGESDGNATSA